MDLSNLRNEYLQSELSKESMESNPCKQFSLWFEQMRKLDPPGGANAMSLATASASGMPRLRTVLLKYFDNQGFVFFTNYNSQKAKDIEQNPQACLLFPWLLLERQVIIQGAIKKVSTKESLKYFLSRPRGSQIGAWCSDQSAIVSHRKLMEIKFNEMKEKFKNKKIPLPDFWGGYRVKPERFEFWQGRANRLHDRFEYTQHEDTWQISRLQP